MKRFWQLIFVAMMLVAGCGSKREPLDKEGVKEHFQNAGFLFHCVSDNGGYGCAFFNENSDMLMYHNKLSQTDGVIFHDANHPQAYYSVEKGKIIEGDGNESEIKKRYLEILDSADVKEQELIDTLTREEKDFEKNAEQEKKDKESEAHGLGERIVIEQNGEEKFAITFNSVTATSERNRFHDTNPEQVLFLNYTYENLGMDEDLFISSISFTVIGDDGTVATTYPVSGAYPQACPMGAKSTGDQAYGFETATTQVKVIVEEYVGLEKVRRYFVLDVN